jgi:hypothetical protein
MTNFWATMLLLGYEFGSVTGSETFPQSDSVPSATQRDCLKHTFAFLGEVSLDGKRFGVKDERPLL